MRFERVYKFRVGLHEGQGRAQEAVGGFKQFQPRGLILLGLVKGGGGTFGV